MPGPDMSAAHAVELYATLHSAGVRCWVMGGWGVDALLGRQTRSHKDLDLLVDVADLPAMQALLRGAGFTRKLEWEENVSFERDGKIWASAFVDAHEGYGELDVHVIDVGTDTSRIPVQLSTDPWPLPEGTLSGSGRILGSPVRCVSKQAQLAMHVGYELPPKHRADLELLG
jgi:lincosamide nucleotidyltransferase A/C/D/E